MSKGFLKKILPETIHRWRLEMSKRRFRGLNDAEIFRKVYEERLWGEQNGQFSSGDGTYDNRIEEYINVCAKFINEKAIESVLDIGCGDFSVSKAIVSKTNVKYLGVDVADNVIEHNNKQFAASGIQFKVLHAATQPLPTADLITIRQVLQHLRNDDIKIILNKSVGACRYMLVTEHLPCGSGVVPNVDKDTGPDIRLYYKSGVFIEKPPFDLKVEKILLEYQQDFEMFGKVVPSIIRTSLVAGLQGQSTKTAIG